MLLLLVLTTGLKHTAKVLFRGCRTIRAHNIRPLTLEHDAASVIPDAFVKYFPAGHKMHTIELVAENWPAGHCRRVLGFQWQVLLTAS